jgi:hypothetical protein
VARHGAATTRGAQREKLERTDAGSRSRAYRVTRSGDARLHRPGEDARKRQQSAEDTNVRILKNIALLALVVAIAATLGKYGIDGAGESRNFAW